MTVTIARRFRGPEDSGNGGYTCGTIAAVLGGEAEVTLRHPPPLDVPLAIQEEGPGRISVYDGETLIAEGVRREVAVDVPAPPSMAEAVDASSRYAGFERHAFPTCFTCGPERDEGDGLRIFAGPMRDRESWAAPWRPGTRLPLRDGAVASEIVWAALDCPGAWAVERASRHRPVVLGRMAARLHEPVAPESHYVAIAWPRGGEGRKLYAGTALFGESGALVGAALQTWIVLG